MPLLRAACIALLLLAATVRSLAAQPDPLPLLDPDVVLATTFYGSAEPPEAGTWPGVRIEEAVEAGMNGFTFYIDWPELEPEPGVYNLDALEASLAWLDDLGLTPFVNLTVVDIVTLNLPEEYLDEEGEGFAEGWSFDDPRLVARFLGLLDRVVPLVLEYDGFYLGLGNEVDDRFEEHPGEFESYLAFVAAAVEHVHTLEPELAAGVTVTSAAPLGRTPVFEGLRAVSDVVPFNYYGLDPVTFAAEELEDIPDTLAALMAAYGDDVTMVQETNCVSTEASGSSPALQAQCLDLLLTTMREDYPQIRFVTVFNLFDLDEPTCDLFVELFGFDAEFFTPEERARLRGFVCDLGLVAPDGTPKPAWIPFLEAAAAVAFTSTEPPPASPSTGCLDVYPHPVRAGGDVTVHFTAEATGTAAVALYDLLGRRLAHADVAVQRGTPARLSLAALVPHLSPGLYHVQVVQHGRVLQRPVVVR